MGAVPTGLEDYTCEETDSICLPQNSSLLRMVGEESIDVSREGNEYYTHYKDSTGVG